LATKVEVAILGCRVASPPSVEEIGKDVNMTDRDGRGAARTCRSALAPHLPQAIF
jgi:hypothetical protein